MAARIQKRWCVVYAHGHIHSGYMGYTRRAVIKDVLASHRKFYAYALMAHLSDAQLWRVIKRRRGWTVRRIALRVVR